MDVTANEECHIIFIQTSARTAGRLQAPRGGGRRRATDNDEHTSEAPMDAHPGDAHRPAEPSAEIAQTSVKNDINVYSIHTNLDSSIEGAEIGRASCRERV